MADVEFPPMTEEEARDLLRRFAAWIRGATWRDPHAPYCAHPNTQRIAQAIDIVAAAEDEQAT